MAPIEQSVTILAYQPGSAAREPKDPAGRAPASASASPAQTAQRTSFATEGSSRSPAGSNRTALAALLAAAVMVVAGAVYLGLCMRPGEPTTPGSPAPSDDAHMTAAESGTGAPVMDPPTEDETPADPCYPPVRQSQDTSQIHVWDGSVWQVALPITPGENGSRSVVVGERTVDLEPAEDVDAHIAHHEVASEVSERGSCELLKLYLEQSPDGVLVPDARRRLADDVRAECAALLAGQPSREALAAA